MWGTNFCEASLKLNIIFSKLVTLPFLGYRVSDPFFAWIRILGTKVCRQKVLESLVQKMKNYDR